MRRPTALVLVAVVFLVGLGAGMLGSRLVARDRPAHSPQTRTPPFRGYFPSNGLDLTQEQQRQLEQVFTRQREKWNQIHQDLRPQVESLMAETQSELEQILTAEQLERYRARKGRWQGRPRYRRPGQDPRMHRSGPRPGRGEQDEPRGEAPEPEDPPVD